MWSWMAVVLLLPAIASAERIDAGNARSAFENFEPFVDQVSAILANTLASPLGDFAETLFLFFTATLFIGTMSRYIWQGITFAEIIEKLALIMIVRVMMVTYGPVTTYMWQWANAFGSGIQEVATGSGDTFFVGTFIKNIVDRLQVADVSIFEGVMAAISTALLGLIVFVLSILSFIASAWPIWGYAVAKLTGWMFIPLLLFRPLSFLFNGWLRFFFGFLMFAVFVRVNLTLCAIAFGLYFNLPVGDVPSGAYTFHVLQLSDFFGIAAICLMGVFGLWSTGKFATAVAGGVGGFSDGLAKFAMAAGRLSR
jgi:hypothetical protein